MNIQHPDSLVVDTRGGHKRGEAFLGHWRCKRDGKFSTFWERATEARGLAAEFFIRRASVTADQDLNDAAKARKTRDLSVEYIRRFGNEQHKLTQAVEAMARERQALAAVKPYGPDGAAQAIMDAEIARMIREMPSHQRDQLLPRLVSGEEQRVVEAVLRTPGILTGFSGAMRSAIENAAIRREHPEAVMQQEAIEESAQLAQHVLRGAHELVMETSGMGYSEVLGALGENWRGLVKPIGGDAVTDLLAKRHAAAQETA